MFKHIKMETIRLLGVTEVLYDDWNKGIDRFGLIKADFRKGVVMEYLNIQIDVIKEIRKLINDNIHFDVNKWCQEDVNVLKRAAKIIEEELLEADLQDKTLRMASGIGISKILTCYKRKTI